MRTNIVRMREFDEAWNERRWVDYADLLAEQATVLSLFAPHAQDKQRHIEFEIKFCQLYPNARRHILPYESIFTSADGRRTACVMTITGTRRPDVVSAELPTAAQLRLRAAFICTWTSGAITELHQFS